MEWSEIIKVFVIFWGIVITIGMVLLVIYKCEKKIYGGTKINIKETHQEIGKPEKTVNPYDKNTAYPGLETPEGGFWYTGMFGQLKYMTPEECFKATHP
jgi:hypothetical protein